MLIYFITGIISGISISAYFIGKELFSFHRKNTLQEKQLDRMRKLNHQLSLKISLTLMNNPTYNGHKKGDLAAQ